MPLGGTDRPALPNPTPPRTYAPRGVLSIVPGRRSPADKGSAEGDVRICGRTEVHCVAGRGGRAWGLVPRPDPRGQEADRRRGRRKRDGSHGDGFRNVEGHPGLVQEDGPRFPWLLRRGRVDPPVPPQGEVVLGCRTIPALSRI